jgi:hypothetical protein
MSRFTSTLVVSPVNDGKRWVIRSDFGYDVGEEGSGENINIPKGFVTDFASTPRLLVGVFPRWGKYGNAAVVHDYLYWQQKKYTRERADEIFLEAMEVLGVSKFNKNCLYLAVKHFGFFAWNSHAKEKRDNPIFNPNKGWELIGVDYEQEDYRNNCKEY